MLIGTNVPYMHMYMYMYMYIQSRQNKDVGLHLLTYTPLPMELAAHALFMITTVGISGGIRSSWHQGGTGGENMA